MTLDLTTLHTIVEVKLAPLFECPYCGRPVQHSQRLSYPPEAIGAFATVYQCDKRRGGCGRHIGEPMREESQDVVE